jgi:hypothetical protein
LPNGCSTVQFAGIDLRSILDAGLTWALVSRTTWTVDGVTALAWNHESCTIGSAISTPDRDCRFCHAICCSRVFWNDFLARQPASSSHIDDAMIRSPRMTVASLKQSMDRRFTRLDRRLRRRFDAIARGLESSDRRFGVVDRRFDDLEARLTARIDMRFESLSEKIDAVLTQTTAMRDQFVRVADEHEYRIRDLEVRLPR